MKRTLTVGLALVAVTFIGCKGKVANTASASAEPLAVVATIDGAAITMKELDEAAKSQLQRVETQIYQIKKGALDGMIEEKLIESAAKKKGVAAEKYLAEEVDAKITAPTEEEMKSLYDARKDGLKQPYDAVKDQIKQYLEQNRKSKARMDLLAKLRTESKVEIKMEPPRVIIDTKGAPSIGDDGAKVTVVEFSDYQCPFCKRVRPNVWRLADEYKGKLRYVFMDFPLSFHKQAKKAHEAAHCAGDQDKYFEYNRKIFDNQGKIEVADLKGYAKDLRLNTAKFDKCLDEGKHAGTVEEFTAIGANAGVSGTPAFFVNGVMLSGAQPYEAIKAMVDEELNR